MPPTIGKKLLKKTSASLKQSELINRLSKPGKGSLSGKRKHLRPRREATDSTTPGTIFTFPFLICEGAEIYFAGPGQYKVTNSLLRPTFNQKQQKLSGKSKSLQNFENPPCDEKDRAMDSKIVSASSDIFISNIAVIHLKCHVARSVP